MNILVLNGSPRSQGNTARMIAAFQKGAQEAGHRVKIVPVARQNIRGCLACEYCHEVEVGCCIQQDDMQTLYPEFLEADMLVFASPIYHYSMNGQLITAINRSYALGPLHNIKKWRYSSVLDRLIPRCMTQRSHSIKALPVGGAQKIVVFSQRRG